MSNPSLMETSLKHLSSTRGAPYADLFEHVELQAPTKRRRSERHKSNRPLTPMEEDSIKENLVSNDTKLIPLQKRKVPLVRVKPLPPNDNNALKINIHDPKLIHPPPFSMTKIDPKSFLTPPASRSATPINLLRTVDAMVPPYMYEKHHHSNSSNPNIDNLECSSRFSVDITSRSGPLSKAEVTFRKGGSLVATQLRQKFEIIKSHIVS